MSNHKNYRVYIVEDDLELSTIIGRILRSIDALVELDWATSAEEAACHLKKLSARSEQKPFDLIVADIFLEGAATGLDLWRLCQQTYPEIPLLVTSGTSMDKFLNGMGKNTRCPPFLKKPFSIADCSRILGEMLNEGQL